MRCLRCKQEIDRSFRACPHCGEAITDFVRTYSNQLLDGKYRILGRLGTGGMGEVYQAEHTFLGATRVIKVIRPQISESQDAHDRFLREARLATKVQHPNVATVHDFSALPDGSHYMVWEFIDGENLAQRLRARGPLPPRTAVRLIIQALHGLEAIHRAGIVHRDISPENLMISRADDSVKIIDLGVAKTNDAAEVSGTATGIFVGKLRYASPEQLGFLPEDEKVDGRADVYAIGMVLYETLAGRPPFEATSPHQYFLMHSEDREFRPVELPPDLAGGAELQAAIRKSLQRDRNKRFSSARDFAEALVAVERSLPDPGSMKTVAAPADFDSTMRVGGSRDTLHRTTQRSEATLRTPIPQAPSPDPTMFAPRSQPAPPPPMPPIPAPVPAESAAEAAKSGTRVIVALLAVLFLFGVVVIGGGLWWVMRSGSETEVAENGDPSQAGSPTTPSQTAIDVTDTSGTTSTDTSSTDTSGSLVEEPVDTTSGPEEPEETEPVTPASPAPPRRSPTTPRSEEPAPSDDAAADAVEEPAPAPPTVADASNTYTENGDEDANERLAESMRSQLRGTTRVVLRAGAMQTELENALREEFPQVEIVSSAPVTIDFEGELLREGRGRKSRYARATIRKNGRVIFRYHLPKEVYRVGANPVEAFVGVLEDAF
jgi:serine/threonine protein kinase